MNLSVLAQELGTSDRTLCRLAATGLVRSGRRRGRMPLPPTEENWLRAHWTVVSQLRSALRSEPNVRAALLFGSTAKGTDTPASDLDLILDLEPDDQLALRRVRQRLSRKLGRSVDVVLLRDLEAEPETLLPILEAARPLVDRAGVLQRLQYSSRALGARARNRLRNRRYRAG